MLKPFKEREGFDQALQMAVSAMEAVKQIPGPDAIQDRLRKNVFKGLIWMLTEYHGKYSTRYISEKARCSPLNEIHHEHVVPRKLLYQLFKEGIPVREVFGLAVGCVVTRDEHRVMTSRDRRSDSLSGWSRYIEAKVEVFDYVEGRFLTAAELENMDAPLGSARLKARSWVDGTVDLQMDREAARASGKKS